MKKAIIIAISAITAIAVGAGIISNKRHSY